MEINATAMAGTLESSDVQVVVAPAPGELQLEIQSSVLNQYGRQIQKVVMETLERLEVKTGKVTLVDKGALDCTIKARVECAVYRAAGAAVEPVPWGGAVRE